MLQELVKVVRGVEKREEPQLTGTITTTAASPDQTLEALGRVGWM